MKSASLESLSLAQCPIADQGLESEYSHSPHACGYLTRSCMLVFMYVCVFLLSSCTRVCVPVCMSVGVVVFGAKCDAAVSLNICTRVALGLGVTRRQIFNKTLHGPKHLYTH